MRAFFILSAITVIATVPLLNGQASTPAPKKGNAGKPGTKASAPAPRMPDGKPDFSVYGTIPS